MYLKNCLTVKGVFDDATGLIIDLMRFTCVNDLMRFNAAAEKLAQDTARLETELETAKVIGLVIS